jgi:hypothetical protein
VSSRNELKTRENDLGGWDGLDFGTVRAPGSNPGPPTIFVFRIDDSGRSREPADHSRVTISYGAPKTEAT